MQETEKESRLTLKQRRIVSIISFIVLIVFFGLIGLFIGKPMIQFVSQPEKFQDWVDSGGIMSRILFIGMVVLQVIVALIPGEPLEIGAGYAFGAVEGTILCVIGNLIGGVIIFAFVRTWGIRFVELFFSREKILSLKFLQNQKRVNILIYIVFLVPGTPKDLLSYFAGLTNINWMTWIVITSIARLPSIITSTLCGGALGTKDYKMAIIVFLITLVLSGLGMLLYRFISKKHKNKSKKGNTNKDKALNTEETI